MKILLVNEKAIELESINKHLIEKGHEVESCPGGTALLEIPEEVKYDLVILDRDTWNHGRAIYRYFEKEDCFSQYPVLNLTSHKMEETRITRDKNAKEAFTSKPLNFADMDAKIAELIKA